MDSKRLQTKVGTENYKVKDCPFFVPKENMAFFKAMQTAKENREVSTISPK